MSHQMTANPSLHHGIVLATPILSPSRYLQVCHQNPSRLSETYLYVLGTRVADDVTNSQLAKALATMRDGVRHHVGTRVEISMTGRGTDGYHPLLNIERRPCWLVCRQAILLDETYWRFTREEGGKRKGKGGVRRSIRVFRAIGLHCTSKSVLHNHTVTCSHDL
jgi:hypothetical protein